MGDDRDVAGRRLLAAAQAMRGHALARLETLVMAESPSDAPDLLSAVNHELAAAYAAVGAGIRWEPGPAGEHLVCHWPADGAGAPAGHILIIGHSDTVFPKGTTATRPFRLAADGDTVTGPGVYDMKGALVAVELAMMMLAEAGTPLRRAVRLVIVNDEETGSPDGQRVVAAHADGAVAAIGLEPPMPDGGLKVGRRGVARVEIAVDGVEAHAGLDAALGVPAIDELVDHLVALRGLRPGPPDAAVNIGVITGGTRANVVAGHARAEVGLRFATAEAERAVLQALESLRPVRPGATVRTNRLSYRPAWAPDPANPLAAELVALAAGMGITLSTGFSGGAGDTNLTGAMGIPTVDGLGPDGSGAHAASEQASIRSLLRRAALLAAYLS
ncbi:M20 family metallopeptidase [Planosporangium thailandense]|uniref:M20 family metallopeptidase n=1 Tax=Planosporangium thailandense TaxID=765197 RepID=A0ABX0YAJ3_9ACTN|nr:M20/M25/M40 family metallo-hydrolase [Planosporangium thailandense]NJC74259.1 M20 family metallopeptidase [Planosporangium thailandense]